MGASTWQKVEKVVFVFNFLLGDACTQDNSRFYFSPIFEKILLHKRRKSFGIVELFTYYPGNLAELSTF